MRSAMARFLTVNDFSGSPPVPRGNQGFNLDPEHAPADSEFGVEPDSYGVEPASYGVSTTLAGGTSTTGKNRNDQGPCLYFGPQGQRCNRPATANGFCARHTPARLGESAKVGAATYARPGAVALGSRPLARIIAVGIAIFAALWPVVADLLREIIRWIQAH
jgi:Family of unknown function (DUF5763)